jgi:hypothetical protein
MTRTSVFTVACCPLIFALATGCATTWLKKSPGSPEPKPSDALLTAMVVQLGRPSSSSSKSVSQAVVGLAISAAQNAELAEFGTKATERLTAVLLEQGYALKTDGARTRPLDAVQAANSAVTSAVTGRWSHPDGSMWIPSYIDSLFVKPRDILAKVVQEGKKEYFSTTEIFIYDSGVIWLCGLIWQFPVVQFHTVIYDEQSRKVLDMQGYGSGDGSLFIADHSKANLDKALTASFDSIRAVKEEPL